MGADEGFYFFAQFFITSTNLTEEGSALAWLALKCGVKDFINLLPSLRCHLIRTC
jgi:hypothetical protein